MRVICVIQKQVLSFVIGCGDFRAEGIFTEFWHLEKILEIRSTTRICHNIPWYLPISHIFHTEMGKYPPIPWPILYSCHVMLLHSQISSNLMQSLTTATGSRGNQCEQNGQLLHNYGCLTLTPGFVWRDSRGLNPPQSGKVNPHQITI